MSASPFSAILIALALQVPVLTIPLQKTPRQVERLPAPVATSGPEWAAACAGKEGWNDPAPPVRIHGNSYYVGTCGIASILVTSPSGHVLIDGGTEQGADLIASNIRQLGFRLSDVRILLHSHEHEDHVGGIARLQQLTGAQLYASPEAAAVFKTGAASPDDPQSGVLKPFPAARVDRLVRGGEVVRIGNVQLNAVATPGHTPGALSWRWGACEAAACRQIVYADSLSAVGGERFRFTAHPALVAAFRSSIAKVAALPCDILLTPHPGASNLAERFAGKAPLEDPQACRAHAAKLSAALDARLAKEAGE